MTPPAPNKYLLLGIVAVSAPLSMAFETMVRRTLLGANFQTIREFVGPHITPYAWALVGVTVLAIGAGFALHRALLRRGIAKLGARASDPAAVARVELEAMFLSTSAPQLPTLLVTIMFQWGASFTPVAVCMALSTVGVLLLGLVGPRVLPAE